MSLPRNDTPGILRKTTTISDAPERHLDLLVFGYQAKLYRDDVKAREIDQGKHLIPWMGENNLKIDRYDVRGALYDLTPYEPPPGGYENRLDCLTADEQRAEQLCEEERYLFLYKNEEDVTTKQEEELKRLKQETNGGGYSQVGFSYDQSQPIGPIREEDTQSPTCEEPEQLFQLPHNFEVPLTMELPETMKQHAIIEKTARFIASQGVQMEILLKAKQSNNVQFEFLSQSSVLYPYYKHVVNAIKNGTYPEVIDTKDSEKDDNSANATTNDDKSQKPVVLVPMVKYKPSADCAYTQLISKIKGVPLSELHDESSRHSTGTTEQPESSSASPSITPVLLQYNGATFVTEQGDTDTDSNGRKKDANNDKTPDLDESGPKVEILKNSSALALAQNYSSDSESENEEEAKSTFEKEKTPPNLDFPLPTDNLKNIIDKTAVYVIKNGRQFEETLRSKSAERFTFLLPDNEFYPYYMYKITGDHNAASKERKQRKAKEVAEALLSKKGLTRDKTTNNTVSFSIKKDESPTTTLQQTVLPQDTSDDEDKSAASAATNNTANQQANRHVPIHVQKAIELVESQLMARNAQIAAAALALRQTNIIPIKNVLPNLPVTQPHPTKATGVPGQVTISGKEAERNAIFEQQQQQRHKELKKAEEKVKDKLAQIAREKLGGLVSKEKQLQLERKRKAMAFLNQIKAVSSGENCPANDVLSDKVSDSKDPIVSDDSDDSVRSIPITSYGPDENSEDENPEETSKAHKIPSPIEQSKIARTKLTKPIEPDHVSLIPELNSIRKRKSRSRSRDYGVTTSNKRQYRKQESHSSSCSSDNNIEEDEEDEEEEREKYRSKSRSKSKSHKSKKSKSKKSKSKKKSKKRTKSKSRSRSRSNYRSTKSRRHSVSSDDSTSDGHHHHHHYKEKRHRYECS
ncbi:suppressor of white-apricot [Haematobia irritans]|uniref:suppressor of white-apricot n=1 Tax=Haematobia irritans TaxID=7368 RepID=UPI003F4FF527